MEKIGYIYAVARKAMERGIPVEDALEMIRDVLGEGCPAEGVEKTRETA